MELGCNWMVAGIDRDSQLDLECKRDVCGWNGDACGDPVCGAVCDGCCA